MNSYIGSVETAPTRPSSAVTESVGTSTCVECSLELLLVELAKLSILTALLSSTNDGYQRIHSPHVQDVIQVGSVHLFV